MHKNYINGEWRAGDNVSRNMSPNNINELIGEYAEAGVPDVQLAIEAAHKAFPGWSRSSLEMRSDILDKIGSEILMRMDELGQLLAMEEGKTLPEATAEVVRAGRVFKYFSGEVLRLKGELYKSVREGLDVEVFREPEGVIGIITPWNFPIAIPAWKIAPALAYGNTVVFKPAEIVPGSAWALTEIISRSGIPEGVFNLTMGKGSVVGQEIVESRLVRGVTFTGSVPTGRIIGMGCMERGKKVQMELGGKNPLIIADDADLDVAVSVATNGAYFSTGQRCTASSRIIVERGIHDQFVAAMIAKISSLKVDHAMEPGVEMGPVVSQLQLDQDLKYIGIGQDEGATLAFGGNRLERANPGFYLEPTLFVNTTNKMKINTDEIFGPVASVIAVDDYDEAIEVANDTAFGLSSGICTTSLKKASDFKKRSAAGMAMVNVPTAGVDYHVPFGGRKASSYGPREQGAHARDFYTVMKTAYTQP